MFEVIFEFLGEILLQAFGELLLEMGLRSIAAPFQRYPSPWLAALGYSIFGLVLGGCSLLVFPANMVSPPWRIVNLIFTPLFVGGMMALIGAWRIKHGKAVLRIDRFVYGYLFALMLALIRFKFGK